MSVGVCIINRNGIALAADSAGTYNNGNKMFYNSMNKVFSLSRKYTYGAITYGATTIHNTLIDQILKEFRLYLDQNEQLLDFFEILPSFKEFIAQNNSYYKFDISEKYDCNSLIKSLVDDWGNRFKSVIAMSDAQEKITGILKEFIDYIDNSIFIEDYDVSDYIKQKYRGYYDILVKIVVPELENFPEIKEKFWDNICRYFNLSLNGETNSPMGLFFAGYAKNDAFPKFIHIEIYNVIAGKLKYKIIDSYEESDNNAQIIPLAQRDVILTFCKGISNQFLNYIPNKVNELIASKISSLPPIFTKELKEELTKNLSSIGEELSNAIINTSQEQNISPILNSVQLIPLPEMAFLAENLVNITSLKRTFAIDGYQQTVGGPTDVAVISKGDGFVWIKRKLYFEKDINLNYLQQFSNFK